MSVYLVALTDGIADAVEAIKARWPDHHYAIKEGLIMVSAQGISAPSQIAETIGIAKGADAPCGIVLSMNRATASGVLTRAAVDWYRAAQDG